MFSIRFPHRLIPNRQRWRDATLVRARAASMSHCPDRELVARVECLRSPKRSMGNSEALVQSVAIAVSAIERVHGIRLHDVQIVAAIALCQAIATEVQTGEGKTCIAATAALALASLGESVHVATSNEYLAERDSNWTRCVAELLGLRCAVTRSDGANDFLNRNSNAEVYSADIVYGSGSQFGFDFLFQQYEFRCTNLDTLGCQTVDVLNGSENAVHGQLHGKNTAGRYQQASFAIVDEADSVLIDEAVSPLILAESGSQSEDIPWLRAADGVARKLVLGSDFKIDRRGNVEMTCRCPEVEHSVAAIHRSQLKRPWKSYVLNALIAHHQMRSGVQYVVASGKVCLVDRQTGRLHSERHFQNGLHEAIEVKEGLTPTGRESILARTTRQSFYQRYAKLTGMSGTMMGVRNEARSVYGLDVISLPPNCRSRRLRLRTRAFATEEAKFDAISQDCSSRQKLGQPVLIGTRTIEGSERLATHLAAKGVSATILNGTQDREEADIVRCAGSAGMVTIATNMAGRGTDILVSEHSKSCGGLHVIVSEPNSSARSDCQLFGRTARQGAPGSVQLFVSSTDELVQQEGPWIGEKMQRSANSQGEAIQDYRLSIEGLQRRREAAAFESRMQLMASDEWFNKVRKTLARVS